jgi:hypothetical protein
MYKYIRTLTNEVSSLIVTSYWIICLPYIFMKKRGNLTIICTVLLISILGMNIPTAAADSIQGRVIGGGAPIAKSTVTLWVAGESNPVLLVTTKTDNDGQFTLKFPSPHKTDTVFFLLAKGGEPTAGKVSADNPAIELMTVLGNKPPAKVTANEMTTVASVWHLSRFIKGHVLVGNKQAIRTASDSIPYLVDLETGGYGSAFHDPLNSSQKMTMEKLATLSNLLAGCVTQVTSDACDKLFTAATPPNGNKPADTLSASESISQHPSYEPERLFALLDQFYPIPKDKNMRAVPYTPYLSSAPGNWNLQPKFNASGHVPQ